MDRTAEQLEQLIAKHQYHHNKFNLSFIRGVPLYIWGLAFLVSIILVLVAFMSLTLLLSYMSSIAIIPNSIFIEMTQDA